MTEQLEPQVNADALRLAVKAIEANPENWHQGNWVGVMADALASPTAVIDVCRGRADRGELGLLGRGWRTEWVQVDQCHTTYCLAGQALLQAGMIDEEGRYTDGSGKLIGDNNARVDQQAAELLGLTNRQAKSLFYWGVLHHEYNAGNVEAFKRHITEVTGVTFED